MAEPNPNPAPNPNPNPAPAPAADWLSGVTPEHKGYIETKGWKNVGDLVGSYQNAEKLIGVPPNRVVKLPEKADDAESWGKVWGQLGRPEKADDYAMPKEGDADFMGWARGAFHKANLTKAQAEALTAAWGEYATGAQTKTKEAYAAAVEADAAALKKDWGAAHDENVAKARLAARELGFDAETIDKLETALGFAGTMKLFHKLGGKVGEAEFHANQGGNTFGALSPAAAKARIDALKADKDWTRRYVAGGAAERDEWDRLHKWAYPPAA